MNKFCVYIAAFLMVCPDAIGQEKDYYPVVDLNGKLGNNRTIGKVELSVPLAQEKDKILFTDIRTVWGDQGEREGNFGLGYREVKKHNGQDYIVGGYGFFDRRKSENNNFFNQVTVGGELMTPDWRARANYYHPTTGAKVASDDADTATLRPDGFVFVDEGQTIEEPLRGFDFELSARVPQFKKHETWVHGAAYHFGLGSDVNLNGVRFRAETEVIDNVRVGIESSYDNIRKDNHFFNVRWRIPLQKENKKPRLSKSRDIYNYMQEPIERDIDIVTNAKAKAPVSAKGKNGKAEKYIFVDNTAAGGGDGTPVNPFNNLADAQAALNGGGNNDRTIFVRQGDGTTTNNNSGITLDRKNTRFIGSGIDLTTRQGVFIEGATSAAKITNIGGDAVVIAEDDIEVAGFDIASPSTDGIFALNQDGAFIHDNIVTGAGNNGINIAYTDNKNYTARVEDNILNGNVLRGLRVRSFNGANVTATISDNIANGNTQEGFRFEAGANNSSLIITSSGNTTNSNGGNAGLYSLISGNADFTLNLNNHMAQNNSNDGILLLTGGSGAHQLSLNNITANSNTDRGLVIDIQDTGTATVSTLNTQTNNNGDDGLQVISRADTTATVNVTNHVSNMNGQQGIDITANGTSAVLTSTLINLTSTNSGNGGLFLKAQSSGTLNATLSNSMLTNNTGTGIFVEGAGTANNTTSVFSSDMTDNSTFNIQLSDTTSGTYNVDFGGGGLGSIGNNRIFNSGNQDVFGNLNGSNVSAQSNWWGVGTGLSGAETNLISGGSVDATTPLALDPRP